MENTKPEGTWLDKLARELAEISEVEANSTMPDKKLYPHDHVVGVLTPDLQKLRYLFLNYQRLGREAAAAAMALPIQERKAIEDKIQRYEKEFKAIYEIFWTSCCYAFPILNDKNYIGIKEGWKIVWSDHPSEMSLDFLLKQIFGSSETIGELIAEKFSQTKPDHKNH